MNTVCMYFEVHQPYRLRPYTFFDIGQSPFYMDDRMNREVLAKVSKKCYIPATRLLLDLISELGDDFRVSFSITGVAIEQFREWQPEVLDNFKRLADTGRVEFLGETYYHSLSSLVAQEEFERQVRQHTELMEREFGQTPRAFRNTELIWSNHIAYFVRQMGFETMLMEGADHVLGWRSPNFLYTSKYKPELKLLLKNYRLSDDIAFRFSQRSWAEFPLSANKFASWVHSHAGAHEILNLFMDFETFGEHQWADSGIFEFLSALPRMVQSHPDFCFRTVSETAGEHRSVGEIDFDAPVSWADTERDVSAWLGNSMQREAISALYDLAPLVERAADPGLSRAFGLLQTSDHFYYMCTKKFRDGEVHKYFSPYESPYDAYIYFMNALHDFRQRLEDRIGEPALAASAEGLNAASPGLAEPALAESAGASDD